MFRFAATCPIVIHNYPSAALALAPRCLRAFSAPVFVHPLSRSIIVASLHCGAPLGLRGWLVTSGGVAPSRAAFESITTSGCVFASAVSSAPLSPSSIADRTYRNGDRARHLPGASTVASVQLLNCRGSRYGQIRVASARTCRLNRHCNWLCIVKMAFLLSSLYLADTSLHYKVLFAAMRFSFSRTGTGR